MQTVLNALSKLSDLDGGTPSFEQPGAPSYRQIICDYLAPGDGEAKQHPDTFSVVGKSRSGVPSR